MSNSIRVTIWNEFRHEKFHPAVVEIYPEGIHEVIAQYLSQQGFTTRKATLDEPEHGLTERAPGAEATRLREVKAGFEPAQLPLLACFSGFLLVFAGKSLAFTQYAICPLSSLFAN